MKKLFTIFLSITIAISVIGQSSNKKHIEQKRVNKHKEIIALYTSNVHGNTQEIKNLDQTNLKILPLDKKQRLDSMVTNRIYESTGLLIKYNKYEFVYDAFGNTIMETEYYWYSGSNMWVPDVRFEYTYDTFGYLVSDLEFEWDEYTNTFSAYWKTEYTNDANGNPILILYSYREEITSQWDEYSKNEYTYDTFENLILAVGYNWNDVTNQWLAEAKHDYTYNPNQSITSNIYSNWIAVTNQWKYVTKDEYTYDANENQILLMNYQWSLSGGNEWIEYSKHENAFDANGNLIIHISYEWNFLTSIWNATLETEFVYNANNEIITMIYSTWDTDTNQWNKTSKLDYTYDENGNPMVESFSLWNQNLNEWAYSGKSEYNFNYNYTVSELLLPTTWMFTQDYPDEVFNMLTSINSFGFIDNNWLNTQEEIYYYTEVDVGITETNSNKVSVFPIPANDFIIFNISNNTLPFSIEIFDIQGKFILKQTINNNEQLFIKHLKSGVYMFELSTKGDTYRGKVIIN